MENFTTLSEMPEYSLDYYDYTDYNNGHNLDTVAPCNYERFKNNFLPLFYYLLFVVGFLGNTLVVWVIKFGAQLKSMTDVCLLNLALADLLLVISLPFLAYYATHDWIFGEMMCRSVLGIYYIGFYSGIFFIVLMSIDRYLAVVHAVFALRVRTKTYGFLASMVIWITAFFASFPELLNIKVWTDSTNNTICSAYLNNTITDTHYWTVVGAFKMNILGLLIPLTIVGFCYTMVLLRLNTIRTPKKQAIRLVVVVMMVFFCCWTPYNIATFVRALELTGIISTDCETNKMIFAALQVTETVAYTHSCLNPFLYVFVGQKFKKHLIRLLRSTPCFQLQFMKSYLTQATGSVYSQTTSVEERSAAL